MGGMGGMATLPCMFGLGLEYWTYKRLLREVLVNIDTTIQWCKRNGLLARAVSGMQCLQYSHALGSLRSTVTSMGGMHA